MPPLRLYIETSVWSQYFADDAPQWRDLTREFLTQCSARPDRFALHISDVVLREVGASSPPKDHDLTQLINRMRPTVLDVPDGVEDLAAAYMTHAAIPPSHPADAMHAAIATVHELDGLMSWNFKHMVGLARRRKIVAVNFLMGYNRPIEILTPETLLDEG